MSDSYNLSMRNPILYNGQTSMQNPTTRLTLEQQYANLSNQMLQQSQPQQSNPYTDYINVMSSLSETLRGKLIEDNRYTSIYAQCENVLKQYLYAQAIPIVLSDPQGRILFEQLYNISKSLKEEYTQKDIQKEKQLEALMNDPVVMQRLMEIQSGRTIPQQQPQQQRVEPASSSAPTNSNHQNSKGNQQKYQQNKSQPGDTLE